MSDYKCIICEAETPYELNFGLFTWTIKVGGICRKDASNIDGLTQAYQIFLKKRQEYKDDFLIPRITRAMTQKELEEQREDSPLFQQTGKDIATSCIDQELSEVAERLYRAKHKPSK